LAEQPFDVADYTFEHLPERVQRVIMACSVGPVAAAEVDTSERTVRRARGGGDCYQRVWAWRATRDGIAVGTCHRGMRPAGGRRYRPSGELSCEDVRFHAAVGVPDRRRGIIPLPEGTGGRAAGGGVERLGGYGQDAERVLEYVPPVVAAELCGAVPAPVYQHSRVRQWGRGDMPECHELVLLRMGERVAVLVTATQRPEAPAVGVSAGQAQRLIAGCPWTVTRYRYELTPARAVLPGAGEAGGPAGAGSPRVGPGRGVVRG
jgi:hypothetical protein